ncbi:alpha/beta hydrolase [Glaciihabitans sp. UYNi722]|uniref:alpha/beta hydrolase n=1 Tax=Glaciihabitans sp. UYNi722 TaxID=3156344 RepID=UPI0033919949
MTLRTAGRRAVRIVVAVVAVLIVVVVGFAAWANIVMQGDRVIALKAWNDASISVESTDHSIVLIPRHGATGTGLVFIPGAKVDPYAYMYKLSGIVEKGVTVVITKPTLNLAFFDQRPLATFTTDAPDVTRWFVGGHSLGGVRACMLADSKDVAGLVLFGSYCANDLSRPRLDVLSIGGSRDGLSTPAKIASTKPLLPADADFVEIAGANHAAFGDYGVQPGDRTATITSRQARTAITDALDSVLG